MERRIGGWRQEKRNARGIPGGEGIESESAAAPRNRPVARQVEDERRVPYGQRRPGRGRVQLARLKAAAGKELNRPCPAGSPAGTARARPSAWMRRSIRLLGAKSGRNSNEALLGKLWEYPETDPRYTCKSDTSVAPRLLRFLVTTCVWRLARFEVTNVTV